jgi:hypothetical protein
MSTKKDDIVTIRQRKYLAKDFDGLRSQILEYARLYYPDKIKDFSESSIGGMFLDMAAYVGDNMSFYLDHQFGELDPNTAVETINVQRHLRNSGVPIVGTSPALVSVDIYLQVPAALLNGVYQPQESALPIIRAGSKFDSNSGITFNLMNDVDFSKRNSDGELIASYKIGQKQNDGITPRTFVLWTKGLCISGSEHTDVFTVGGTFTPFRKFTLTYPNVSEIISVTDGYGNIYYRVNSLTQDVIYKNVLNTLGDNDLVPETLKTVPAPYRFVAETELSDRKTTLVFGGGSSDTLDDDIIMDPSEFAMSLPYSKTFTRLSIDPNQLLKTKTLGVASTNTTVSVNYRYGGGLSHNVATNTIKIVKTLKTFFPLNPAPSVASFVRTSLEVNNTEPASGGEDAPTAENLKALIPVVRNSQERIVSKEDLIARVYTLPSNFGRVFRATVKPNSNNPLATQLYIISRDARNRLITSPDSLKLNLQRFLSPYRLISDAIDILDARVINLTFHFECMIDPSLNKNSTLQKILLSLENFFRITNFHIDQPIIMSDVTNLIYKIPGVISVEKIEFRSISGVLDNRTYSEHYFDVSANTKRGIIIPLPGSIFELRYPDFDLEGKVT